jgi:hypothetical protein
MPGRAGTRPGEKAGTGDGPLNVGNGVLAPQLRRKVDREFYPGTSFGEPVAVPVNIELEFNLR